MDRLARTAQVIGVNTVPFTGVMWGHWSEATVMAFYWCETALVVAFVAFRLVIHRRLTQKRGHYVEQKKQVNRGPWKRSITTYNKSFLTAAIAFGTGNLIFLLVLLGLFSSVVGGGEIDLHTLGQGVLIALGFVAVGFAADLPGIGDRPFIRVRLLAEGALWRVFVIYFAIFIGVFSATVLNMPHAMFSVFFGLRLFTDIASNFKQYDPEDPPRWVLRFVKDRQTYVREWRQERATRLASQAEDEKRSFVQ